MKMRRLTLPLAEARPGMRLAADVRGSGGTVLFAGGTELAEAGLASLRRRGIESVTVEVADPRSEEEIARELAAMEARVAHLFHRHLANPDLRELMQVVLEYRRRGLA